MVRQQFGRKGAGSPGGPHVAHETAACPCSKGSQLHTELYKHEQRQYAEGYETTSGALCPLLDSTVHQQTGMSPEEATEMVRGLKRVMYEEGLRAGFVQHGEGKASGRGSPKGQMEPDSSVVHCDRQQTTAGTWKIPIR